MKKELKGKCLKQFFDDRHGNAGIHMHTKFQALYDLLV